MPRTYPDRGTYDAACERLAAHLNTLDGTQYSLVYADGGTTDAGGRTWVPAGNHLVEPAAWNTWFIEEHGAGAQWDGGQFNAAEPGADELADSALALWGEGDGDFGYPPPGAEADRRVPLFSWVIETSDGGLGRETLQKIWQTADQGYDDASATAIESARDILDAYLENYAPDGITWDARVLVWGQGHHEETFATADAIVYAGDTAGPDDLDTEYVSENYQPEPGVMDTRHFWIAYAPHVLNYGHQADRIARASGVGETEAAALAAARSHAKEE